MLQGSHGGSRMINQCKKCGYNFYPPMSFWENWPFVKRSLSRLWGHQRPQNWREGLHEFVITDIHPKILWVEKNWSNNLRSLFLFVDLVIVFFNNPRFIDVSQATKQCKNTWNWRCCFLVTYYNNDAVVILVATVFFFHIKTESSSGILV